MKQKKFLATEKLSILDNVWTIEYMNATQYKKLNVQNTRAVTYPRIKKIVFDCSAAFPGDKVAVHELVHAYASELMLHDLPLDQFNFEEFFCVLFEMRGADILKQAKPITKKLLTFCRKLNVKPPEKRQEGEECHKNQ